MKNKSQPDVDTKNLSSLSIGCYSRVSTDEQANVIEGSLDNQRHRMQSFIEVKNMQEPNWGRIVEHFIDDGYSAKDTKRPAYARLMKALKSGKINAIMVTELSRLSRNIPDFCDFHKLLESHGAKFFSIKEQFDSSTPPGKMMLYNMINLAQFEREQTSERVAINCHSRAQRGFLNGGPAILGYDKDPAKKATFIVNEAEAKQLRRIFELFIEQRSLSRTIDALVAEGIKPKSRGHTRDRLVIEGRWTVGSLSFILKNHSYIAVREANKANKNKEQAKLKVWQRYGTYRASWPAILDEVTFKTANQILEENSERERMRLDTSEKRVFAASGLCQCEECGRRLVGQSAHGKKQIHRYYVHSTKKGDVINCSTKRINDLKKRLAAFKRGWTKASAVMKKTLMKDLIYSIIVGPKGLKIQYRLKHDLNKPVTAQDLATAKEHEDNVIALNEKRRAKSSAPFADSASADAGAPEGVDFHNLGILGSQVVQFGRGAGT